MSKRFTDTALIRQPWFRKLSPRLKCAVRFLFDECDQAGVWVIDMETLSYFVGEEVTVLELFAAVNSDKQNRIERFKGDRIFIPGFIEFQYGQLTESCKPHRPILEKLKKYGLYERVLKGYQNPTETLEEKEKDKEEEKETEQEEDKGGAGGNLLVPRMSETFKKHFPAYLPNKERDYKPLFSIANFFCEQAQVRGGPIRNIENVLEAWESVCQYIKTDNFYKQKSISTISNQIQEITQKARDGDKSTSKTKSAGINDDKLKDELSKRFKPTG